MRCVGVVLARRPQHRQRKGAYLGAEGILMKPRDVSILPQRYLCGYNEGLEKNRILIQSLDSKLIFLSPSI